MLRSTARKDRRLSMRLPEADIAIIDRAAGLRGRSRTDFVRAAAVRAAEDVLMETALSRMSPDGFGAFMAVFAAAPTHISEIVDIFRRRPSRDAGID